MLSSIRRTYLLKPLINKLKNKNMYSTSNLNFETLSVTVPKEYVYHVELNRPDKLNAVSTTMWTEFADCFQKLNDDENCRVVLISGAGRLFTAGIDFKSLLSLAPQLAEHDDIARKAKVLLKAIYKAQAGMSAIELCHKPVIAAVHNACIGFGVDIIAATDIRYCTKDAWFQVKEVAIGMAADVGVLQRLPKIVKNDSVVRELCYTARKFSASEALELGLVSKVCENKEKMIEETLKVAEEIAKQSPVAVQTTKRSLVYSRDHTAEESLEQLALLNQFLLQSEDFTNATVAQMSKDTNVKFSKL